MTLENSLSVCYSSLVINFLSSGSYSLTPLPGYLANGKIGVVTDDDDEFDDDDDRSEWHNNPYTRGAYSYLATGVPLELHDMLRQPLPSTQV